MSDGQQIRALMWDYVYGLLTEEESQEMVARIKSDPQVARLYAEVRLKGELVAQAALVEDSSLHLKADPSDPPAVTRKQSTTSARSSAFWYERATKLLAVAACGLIVVLGAGLCWPQPNARVLARNFVVTDVVAPASLPAGLTNSLAVHTYHVNPAGEAAENVATEVQLRLIDSSGKQQFQQSLRTDATGQVNFEIPGAALEPGSRLEVNPAPAKKKTHTLSLATDLPVEPEPEIAYFLNAEPPADPSAAPTANAPDSTWNFNAFSAKPIPQGQSQIAAVADERLLRDLQQPRGGAIVNGYLQQTNRAAGRMPAGQMPGNALARQEPPATSPTQVVEAGQPVQVDIPPQLADKLLDITVLCRGVTVAATMENEAVAKDFRGEEAKFADRKAKIGQRQLTVPLPPEADGLMEVEIYDQNSDQLEPVQRNLVYREPLRKLVVQLPNLQNRFAPGDDVELKLHVVDEKDKPAANTRVGVRVWNERLVQQLGDRPLLLTDAVLKGQGLEYGQNAIFAANQAVANQVGQQTDLRRIKQQANNYQREMRSARAAAPANAPAENPAAGVQLQDRQLNESQQLTNTAAIATTKIELATNRDAVKLAIRSAADQAVARRDRAMHILGVVAVLGGIALLLVVAALAALKLAASVRALAVPLVTALASLLIGIAWVGLPSRSLPAIAMAESADSKSAPASDLAATTAAAESSRFDLRAESQSLAAGGPAPPSATTAPQSASAPQAYALSPGGAPKPTEPADSLGLNAPAGKAGFGAQPSTPALASSLAAAGAKNSAESQKKEVDKEPSTTATPPYLYFNPNLTTDKNGDVTISFKMPSVASEYRLLIDALGSGRIGSRQETLSCGPAGK